MGLEENSKQENEIADEFIELALKNISSLDQIRYDFLNEIVVKNILPIFNKNNITWIESAMIGICLAGLCHDKALDKLKTFSLMPNKEIAISLIEANKKKIFEIGVATRDIINIADSLNLERSKGWKEAKIDFNLISSNLVNRFAILEKYNFSCAYCGRRPPEVALELDHVFPKSKGGTNGSSNRVPACWECNHGKRDKILSEESTKLIKQVIESKDEDKNKRS